MPQLATTWPLVGRGSELERIAAARADRSCRGVVMLAPAGVGKSRLAREAHAQAEREGADVTWIQATRSAGSIPLGAFAGLVPDDVRADDVLELMRRTGDALRERAGGRAIVLTVDDAQRLDPTSAALVLHLALHGDAFVIATVRSGEPCPDAIVSLWKDAGARRLELRRLEDKEITELVETALGGPITQIVAQWALQRSGGNALYVRELVMGAIQAGTLAERGGLWQLTGAPPVSRSLHELVSERLAGLTDSRRTVLELLALSEPLNVAELVELAGESAVVEAEAAGLIRGDAHGELGLAHPLYGDVVRAELPTLRGRRLRPRVAALLQRREPMTADTALRVATLLADAGAPVPSGLLVQAGEAAILAGDAALGVRLGELAVADGGGVPGALLLARAHAMTDGQAEAETALAAIEDQMAGHVLATDYVELRARVLWWGLGRQDDLRALLDRAGTWSTDREWQQRLAPLRNSTIVDDRSESLRASIALLADPEIDPKARIMAEPRHVHLLMGAGRFEEAEAIARRRRPAPPVREPGQLIMLPLYRLAAIESGIGWTDLADYLGRTLREGVRCNDRESAAQAASGLAQLALLKGRLDDARRWLAEAESHFEHEDMLGMIAGVHVLQTGVAAAAGDADEAGRHLARLRAALADGRTRPSSFVPYVLRAEGWEACARNPAAGPATFLAGAERLAPDAPGYAAVLAYDALLAGAAASRVAPLLAECAPRTGTRLLEHYAGHADALANRDGQAVLDVAAAFATVGATRYAMLAATQAAGVLAAAGRKDSARRALTQARAWHGTSQGLPLPTVDGLDGAAVELTTREAQLVALARGGLANPEIADRLVLSIRTVESHLYRAMQKLGVSDRRDL